MCNHTCKYTSVYIIKNFHMSLLSSSVYVPGGCYDYLTLSGKEHVERLSHDRTSRNTLSHIQVAPWLFSNNCFVFHRKHPENTYRDNQLIVFVLVPFWGWNEDEDEESGNSCSLSWWWVFFCRCSTRWVKELKWLTALWREMLQWQQERWCNTATYRLGLGFFLAFKSICSLKKNSEYKSLCGFLWRPSGSSGHPIRVPAVRSGGVRVFLHQATGCGKWHHHSGTSDWAGRVEADRAHCDGRSRRPTGEQTERLWGHHTWNLQLFVEIFLSGRGVMLLLW